MLIHTGQHFDPNMSDVFLQAFSLPKPDHFLNINSMTHGKMTALMLERIEKILLKTKPHTVVVYGDTDSTLAGALAAKKLGIRLAHVEAGLRSYTMRMPEEINRVLTDAISDILFCPTKTAVKNLHKEGFHKTPATIILSGDVMYDAALFYARYAKKPPYRLSSPFCLATIHRAENTDNVNTLRKIWQALNRISERINVVLPLHPRTRKMLAAYKIKSNFQIVDPVGYFEMLYVLKNCALVITDSGGLQKEAFFFKKPCVIVRDETEWKELVTGGFAMLAGTNPESIYACFLRMLSKEIISSDSLYGSGQASGSIVKTLIS